MNELFLTLEKVILENQLVLLVISPGTSQRILSSRSMNKLKSAFMKSRVMILAIKATSRVNIPQQFVHACKYPDCHPHVPADPCTAGSLLCCPPIWYSSLTQNSPECAERPYRHWVCTEALPWPMQWVQYHRQMQYTKHKSIYSILLIGQGIQTIFLSLL